MNSGQSLFSQLIDHLSRHEFRRCVQRYAGNYRVRSFSCWDQFLTMTFAQLSYRESLRDIVACLRSQQRRLYHLGIRGRISRSTLADANEMRDWRIYADFAQGLIGEARRLYLDEDLGVELANTIYALDSTTIDLCIALFPWAYFTPKQHALKLHTLLDLRGKIPVFLRITPARVHDVNMLDQLVPEAGAFYVMDRGYLNFERLHRWTRHGAFFVTRARKNFRFARLISHPVDKSSGVQCDQTIALRWFYSSKGYPDPLRRIRYWDAQREKRLVFLTNNFVLPASVIAKLYHRRWHVELFFKWIKQHLRIKAFYGTSENAVKTQVWIAVCSYLLVAIVRKRLGLQLNLYTMLQILSVSLFEKTPINQAFSLNDVLPTGSDEPKQMQLLDF
ncbi:MAG TPA: IS4 family transposase [Candidatus Udaeobacter sp.]